MLLELLKKNADVICLQEHWLYPDELHRLHMDGYACVAKSGMNCSEKILPHRGRPYGGVAILVKKCLGEPRPVNIDCNRCIAAVVGDSLVVNVYMPCYATDAAREGLYLETVAIVQDCVQAHIKYVITGDFNYDLRQANSSYPCRAWGQLLADHSGVLVSTEADSFTYSHDTLEQKSWLDFAITPASMYRGKGSIIDSYLNLSDHRPVAFQLHISNRGLPESTNENPRMSKPQRIFWTESLREEYFYYSFEVLKSLNAPLFTCKTDICNDQQHCKCLLSMYERTVEGLLQASVGQSSPNQHLSNVGQSRTRKRGKPWWSTYLSSLKEDVRVAHMEFSNATWDEGKRATWVTSRKTFKRAIRAAKAKHRELQCNSLISKWSSSNKGDFWKEWRQLTSKSNRLDVTTKVLEEFRETCAEVFQPNNQQQAVKIREEYAGSLCAYTPNKDCVVITPEDVLVAIRKLKKGKAAGEDGIMVEHLLFAPPVIADHLAYMFMGFLGHGIIPEDFRRGLLVPIPKDSRGDMGDVKNFRPICLNSVILKLFEGIIKVKYASYFVTSSRQFSYKAGSSTISAVEELTYTVQHYLSDSPSVYCAFLDSSKAFDKVVHEGVLHELVKRSAPRRLLGIIKALITECVYTVRGGHTVIEAKAGVKQGSVLSPLLFNMYMDRLSDYLSVKGLGCFSGGHYRGLFMYADDIALVAPSRGALQAMVDTFEVFAKYRSVKLNVAKSCVLVFGRDHLSSSIMFQGANLPVVSKTKYLGIELCSGRRQALSCLVDVKLASYYRAANALLCRAKRTGIFVEPRVQYFLYNRFCMPVIRYGLQIVWGLLTKQDKKRLCIAHNSSIRRMFRICFMDRVPEQYKLEVILDLPM